VLAKKLEAGQKMDDNGEKDFAEVLKNLS